MEVADVKNQIKIKQFKSFYIFTGVEWKTQKIYIEQIAKVSGKELKYIDSITDIYSKLGNKAFIQKSYVYVTINDKELMSNEKIQSQLDKILGNNILILQLTTLDKRLKFYKTYKDTIVEFEKLKDDILRKYIQKEIDLSDKNANMLIDLCEGDYGRCLLEIDKIRRYTLAYYKGQQLKPGAYDKTFITLYENGTIYNPPYDAIFDFVDSILDRKVNLAFNLYHQCLDVGEATMVMISVLYTNTKAVLQVQSCGSSDIAKVTGLTAFQISNAKKHLKKYTNRELIDIMRLCQESQQQIVTGEVEEEFIMENILTKVLDK